MAGFDSLLPGPIPLRCRVGRGAFSLTVPAQLEGRTMELTRTQREILFNAWALAREGKGQVLEDWTWPFADQLRRAGWLETRTEPDGATSWWWTRQAETALDLSSLIGPDGQN